MERKHLRHVANHSKPYQWSLAKRTTSEIMFEKIAIPQYKKLTHHKSFVQNLRNKSLVSSSVKNLLLTNNAEGFRVPKLLPQHVKDDSIQICQKPLQAHTPVRRTRSYQIDSSQNVTQISIPRIASDRSNETDTPKPPPSIYKPVEHTKPHTSSNFKRQNFSVAIIRPVLKIRQIKARNNAKLN